MRWPLFIFLLATYQGSAAYLGKPASFNTGTTNLFTIDAYGDAVKPMDYTQIAGLAMAATGDDLSNYVAGAFITNWPTFGLALTGTTANGPIKAISPLNGKPGAYFYKTNYLLFHPPATNINYGCAIFIAYESTNASGLGNRYLLSGNGSHMVAWGQATVNTYAAWWNSGSGIYTDPYAATEVRWPNTSAFSTRCVQVCGMLFEAGSLTWPKRAYVSINDNIVSSTYTNVALNLIRSGATTIGGAGFAPGNGTYGIDGLISEIVVYTNAISQTDFNRIVSYLNWKYKSSPIPSYAMMDGDMGFIGGAMGTDEKQVAPVFHQLDYLFRPHDVSISASTIRSLANIQADATNTASGTLAQKYFAARSDHLYLLYYGGAYLQTGLAADLWPITSNCMARARSQGYKVPAFTMLPQGGTNDTERIAYNDYVRRDWPHCANVLVDFQDLTFTTSTDYTNTIYYTTDTVNGYVPTSYNSIRLSKFILDKLRPICSTNTIPR